MEEQSDLDKVFRVVREREGIDLREYRRKTVERRLSSRLQKLRCQDFSEYAERLAADPTESRHLVGQVTIKVSRFFRNAPVFACLREQVLPDLVHRIKEPGQELRIWSAGCGNGEEAYSTAILIQEMARRGQRVPLVTIFGTDVDEGALAMARLAVYPEAALAETPLDLIDTYFERQQGRFGPQYEVLANVREYVRFVHHDLLSAVAGPDDSPFDLVLCRNVLIYFERPAQRRVLSLLTASVALEGYLCLGEAEQLTIGHQSEFEVVDRPARLYRRPRFA